MSPLDLSPPRESWQESEPVEVLRSEHPWWEGADAPRVPSIRSAAPGPVSQLRDPAVFEKGDRIFLVYGEAGESGLFLAEVHLGPACQPSRR